VRSFTAAGAGTIAKGSVLSEQMKTSGVAPFGDVLPAFGQLASKSSAFGNAK